MPMYDVICQACGTGKETIFRTVAERDSFLPSCSCGERKQRILSAPMLAPDTIEPFESPKSGRVITSRRQWKEDLARTGSIPWEPGLREEIARNKVHSEEKAFAPVAKAVDETVTAMVAAGKLET